MSKYFTKYLPVEGKIKEGDYIHFDNTSPKRVQEIRGELLWIGEVDNWPEELLRYEIKNCKKVGLFLCYRGIEVGDTYDQEPGINGRVYQCQEVRGNILIDDEGKSRVRSTCFKVIGPISPEATFVQESDEFESSSLTPLVLADLEHKGKTSRVIRIKGPCGYFH